MSRRTARMTALSLGAFAALAVSGCSGDDGREVDNPDPAVEVSDPTVDESESAG